MRHLQSAFSGLALILCLSASAYANDVDVRTKDVHPKRIIKRYLEGWNEHDYNKILSVLHPEFTFVDLPANVVAHFPQDEPIFRAFVEGTFFAFPNFTYTLLNLIDEGCKTGHEVTLSGTYLNDFPVPGFPPAQGQNFSVPGSGFAEIRDGKLYRLTEYSDSAALFNQLSNP